MNENVKYFFDLANFSHSALFEGCEFPWEVLSQIENYLKKHPSWTLQGNISDSAYLINPELISIGRGSVVEPGAYIQGPCLIGDNCVIRHGAYIRGNVIVGNNCVIGHDTEVKNSLFLNGAQAAHFAYIGDSILGNKVNLGAGTKCANLRLDHGFISIQYLGKRYQTNQKKMGAILGDGTQIGCNTVTNPGTLMGKYVHCYPSLNVGGFIPTRSVVRTENKLIITNY